MYKNTFYIQTFGCQMNVNDSFWLSNKLKNLGFEECTNQTDAHICILNTCSVRDKAEQKVYSELGRLTKLKAKQSDSFVAVGGCVANQIGKKFFNRFPIVRLIFGTDGIISVPESLLRLCREPDLKLSLIDFTETYPERKLDFSNDTISPLASVNIMQGCNNFCAYCIVPYVRGKQKSRNPDNIIEEISSLVKAGASDITLLGQNVNSYGQDLENINISFAKLLYKIADIPNLKRLRFMTSHPKDIAPEIINAFVELEVLCPRLHLPLQSGSDFILKQMGRKYNLAHYIKIIDNLKKIRPDIQLSTDIIVGFPGETEEDFELTMTAMKNFKFLHSYSFCYSDRPGTRACLFKNKIPKEVALERLNRLQKWQNQYTQTVMQEKIGDFCQVLIDNKSKRPKILIEQEKIEQQKIKQEKQESNEHINLENMQTPEQEYWQGHDIYGQVINITTPKTNENENLMGQFLTVKITEAKKHCLVGERVL